MAKETAAPVSVASESSTLPLKPVWFTVDSVGQRTKSVILDCPDEYTPQMIHENPGLFRLVQKDRMRALHSLDRLTIIWFDRIAVATVDHGDPEGVTLCKMQILERRQRDRTPWVSSCGQYEVRPHRDGWGWYRRSDNVRMSGDHVWPNWEGARNAALSHAGVRVA